jgi:hypothetical protein
MVQLHIEYVTSLRGGYACRIKNCYWCVRKNKGKFRLSIWLMDGAVGDLMLGMGTRLIPQRTPDLDIGLITSLHRPQNVQ